MVPLNLNQEVEPLEELDLKPAAKPSGNLLQESKKDLT